MQGTLYIEYGGLAQLGEHLPYKQRVSGSIPLTSTFELLAQLVEHLTFNQRVTGSSPVQRIVIMRVWRNWQTHQI